MYKQTSVEGQLTEFQFNKQPWRESPSVGINSCEVRQSLLGFQKDSALPQFVDNREECEAVEIHMILSYLIISQWHRD